MRNTFESVSTKAGFKQTVIYGKRVKYLPKGYGAIWVETDYGNRIGLSPPTGQP